MVVIMKLKEMNQVVDMLYEEWDLGKTESGAKGKTCAWIYLFEILEESEKIILEKSNNKVIGICGYSKWNSKKHLIRKWTYSFLKKILIHSPMIKNKQAIFKYNEDYDYVPNDMANCFDGEISILIVNKDYRGKNVGKKLLTTIFEIAKNDDMKNIQILTDESCNYKFYQKLGCQKVYEKIIPNGEPDKLGNITSEKGYIYEKKFTE